MCNIIVKQTFLNVRCFSKSTKMESGNTKELKCRCGRPMSKEEFESLGMCVRCDKLQSAFHPDAYYEAAVRHADEMIEG